MGHRIENIFQGASLCLCNTKPLSVATFVLPYEIQQQLETSKNLMFSIPFILIHSAREGGELAILDFFIGFA